MRNLLTLVLAIVMVLILAWAFQRRLIYFPFGRVPDPHAMGLTGATVVTFPTADGLTLGGWFVARTPDPRATVIVFNGNAGNRAMRAPFADILARQDMAVLLFDYRGFGGNPGSPTEDGLRRDARAARDYVLARPDVDARRVVYFGESLGAAVAAELAVEHPPAALILRSPFTSLVDVGQYHYPFLPVRSFLHDRFDTIGRIPGLRAPLLVIAGDRDGIIPIEQSRRLYETAPEPKWLLVVANADHNDAALLGGKEMIDGIRGFLAKVLKF